jgi:integrase
MRQFSSFLITLNYPSYLPALPKIKDTHTPYIYTKEEIAAIFAATDQLSTQSTCYNSMVLILPSLIRLLYGTGLRLGEALALSCRDVHLEEQYIVLRDTKNGTDRMVPTSGSLTQVIAEYLNCRKRFPLITKTDLLFVQPNGDCCYSHRAYEWFRKVLYKAGIPHKGKHQGPHLHDLRHTFSVHSLAKMAEAGTDLYYSLPVLSTYLGHRSIASTDGYVRLTADMYPSIITKVNNVCPYLFPEISKNTSHENS